MTVLGPACAKSVRSHTDSAWGVGGGGWGDTIWGGGSANREPGSYDPICNHDNEVSTEIILGALKRQLFRAAGKSWHPKFKNSPRLTSRMQAIYKVATMGALVFACSVPFCGFLIIIKV